MQTEHFEIDTKGLCLLCLKDSARAFTQQRRGGGGCSNKTETAFKMLLRYLKIDVFKLSNFSSSLDHMMDGMENTNVMVSLCNGCTILANEFCQLFQKFEFIRMKLDKCVIALYDFIKEGDDCQSRLQEFRRRLKTTKPHEMVNLSIAENLRKEARQKCFIKANSAVPRISLWREQDDDINFYVSPASFEHRAAADVNLAFNPVVVKLEACYSNVDVNDFEESFGSESIMGMDKAELFQSSQHAKTNFYFNDGVEDAGIPQSSTSGGGSKEAIACDHCGKSCSNSGNYTIHQMTLHTLHFYSEVLPTGTSSNRLEKAIKIIMNKYKVMFPNTKKSHGCSLCDKQMRGNFWLRYHMLKYHFDEVHGKVQQIMDENPVENPGDVPVVIGYNNEGPIYVNSPSKSNSKTENSTKIVTVDRPKMKRNSGSLQRVRTSVVRQSGSRGGSKSTKCVHCGKKASDHGNLQVHLITLHPEHYFADKLPASATEADVKTAIQSIVDEHRHITHDRLRQYGCPQCPQNFKGLYALKYHVVTKHLEEVVRKLEPKADVVGLANVGGDIEFNDDTHGEVQNSLHAASSSTLDLSTPKKRKYTSNDNIKASKTRKCNLCGKVFSSKRDFTRHYRMHTGEKQFACTYCGKRSAERYSHHLHEVLVHPMQVNKDRIPPGTTDKQLLEAIQLVAGSSRKFMMPNKTNYQCPYCSKNFKSPTYWKFHVMKDHFDRVLAKLATTGGFRGGRDFSHRFDAKPVPFKRKFARHTSWSKRASGKVNNCYNDGVFPFTEGTKTCEYCGSAQVNKYDYRVHLMRVHTAQFVSKYLPPNTSVSNRKLGKTIESVLGDCLQPSSENQKYFPCSQCSKGFGKRSDLKVHTMRVHMSILLCQILQKLNIPTDRDNLGRAPVEEIPEHVSANGDELLSIESARDYFENDHGGGDDVPLEGNENEEDERPIHVSMDDELFPLSLSTPNFDPLNECN